MSIPRFPFLALCRCVFARGMDFFANYFAKPIAFALALMHNSFTQSELCHEPPTNRKTSPDH